MESTKADGDAGISAEMPSIVAETPGIGLYSERGLHAALKAAYAARPGARVEAAIGGRIVDVALPDELVEIQTRNLGSIAEKVLGLACLSPVRIVHPVIVDRTIVRIDPSDGSVASTRRARTGRDFYSLFDELVRASILVASPNVRFDVVLVRATELRTKDGSGSWRRRGDRTLSRDLDAVVATTSLDSRADWLGLLPSGLSWPADSAALGAALGISPPRARKILYVYGRAGLLTTAGKAGKRKLYSPIE